jgi:hypothetical protein
MTRLLFGYAVGYAACVIVALARAVRDFERLTAELTAAFERRA